MSTDHHDVAHVCIWLTSEGSIFEVSSEAADDWRDLLAIPGARSTSAVDDSS